MPELTTPSTNRLILLAVWLLLYCSFTLLTPPLLDDADSVHAEVAREMLLRHDYITLYANGIRYLEKAPLFYWLEAAGIAIFGPSAAASRLPLAASVLALVLLLEAFARRAFLAFATQATNVGLYAGLITLSSFGIFIFSRINIPDVLVCALLTLAVYAYLRSESEPTPTRRWPLVFAAACALTLLTKGLIGIVFPVAIVGAHLVLTHGLRPALTRLRALHPIPSAALLLAIAAPWHILAALRNPTQGHPASVTFLAGHLQVPQPTDGNVHGWAWFYFINEQLLRYLNLRVPRDYDTVPLWLFLGLILIWLMPWSAFLPAAITRALPSWQRLSTHTLTPAESTNTLLLLWAALPLAFFAFSTRQEYYVLPALPAMILLIANSLSPAPEQPATTKNRPAITLVLLGTTISVAILFFLLRTHAPATTDLASLLHQNPADYALSFGHFLDLTGPALTLFRLPLALTAATFFLGPLAHLILRRRKRPHAATLALACAASVFLIAAHRGLVLFAPVLSSALLADSIRPQLHPQDLLCIHGEYEAGSSLGFYLHRADIHILEGRSSNLWYGSFFPDAPSIFESRASLASRWSGPQRIFLWQDPQDVDRPALTQRDLPSPIYVIASAGGKQVLSNQP